MFDDQITWEQKPAWLNNLGVHSEIALASRIRLARNVKGVPFPQNAPESKLDEIVIQVQDIFEEMDQFTFWPIHRFSNQQRLLLQEKRLISPEFAKQSDHAALAFDSTGLTSIAVNEEDHIRLQVLDGGFNLEFLWGHINDVDQIFDRSLEYSFSDQLGYLTSSPTNTGTGLRISLLLHLPALELEGRLESIFEESNFFELNVCGFYGQGNDLFGSIYQISNRLTLGLTEFSLLDDFLKIGSEIVDKEQEARQRLLENRGIEVEDKVFRSLGILKHAKLLNTFEFIEHYSNLLLGINIGLIAEIDKQELHDLLLWTQPAHLQWRYGKELNSTEQDAVRAEVVKARLRI